MKSHICLTALALAAFVAGCGPRLAETPLGSEEKRWEEYIQKSYPGWKAPQTVPPVDSKAKVDTEAPALEMGNGSDEVKPMTFKEEVVVDSVVTDEKGKVLSETVTTLEVKAKGSVYVVQKNDTLWKIARKFYNDGTKWKKIQAANKSVLKGSDRVLPGMTLQIPAL